MGIISISLPDDLVAEVDAAIAAGDYQGRSEYLRAAARHHLQQAPAAPAALADGHLHGSITVVYGEGNEPRISETRHAYHDVVLSLMHTHCEPEVCMDVLIVGGPADRVGRLQTTLERMREVKRSTLVVAPS